MSPWSSKTLSTTSIQDHHRLHMEDSVSALSIATIARETTQHTLQRSQRCSQKKGATLRLYWWLMMETCITSAGPHCMLSVVITVTDCLCMFICCRTTLRSLVVEDHEQRKQMVATIHDSNSNNIDNWKCSTWSMYWIIVFFMLDIAMHVHCGQHTSHNPSNNYLPLESPTITWCIRAPISQEGPQIVNIPGLHGAPKH